MMALALPFAYMQARAGMVGVKVFLGIMLGIFFHMLNSLFSHIGLLQNWPPLHRRGRAERRLPRRGGADDVVGRGARRRLNGSLSPFDERGLLGVALQPKYQQNGLLYTYTSEPNSRDEPTLPTFIPRHC